MGGEVWSDLLFEGPRLDHDRHFGSQDYWKSPG